MNENTQTGTQPMTSPEESNPQHSMPGSINWSKTLLYITLGVIVVLVAMYVGYYLGKKQVIDNQKTSNQIDVLNETTSTSNETSPTAIPESDQPEDWKTYTNTEYNFTIKFPPTFSTQVGSAGAGTMEAPTNARNLYIYNLDEDPSYVNRYVDIEYLQLEPTYSDEWTKNTMPLADKNVTKLVNSNQTSSFDIYLIPLENSEGLLQIYVSNEENKEQLSNQILSTLEFAEN